jgi:predicted RNA-binding protein with PIN domain
VAEGARYLLVDGHSVIFGWPDLRRLHEQKAPEAREALVRRLRDYQDASGVRVVTVFDGKGSRVTEVTEPGGVQIFYSAAGQTADSVIERLVALYGKTYALTVATSDRAEQETAASFGADWISAEGLRDLLDAEERDFARRMKRHRRRN